MSWKKFDAILDHLCSLHFFISTHQELNMFKGVEEHTKIKAMKHGSLAKQFPRQIMMALYLLHGNSREGKELSVGKKENHNWE